jgi:metallo-beta-lactamase class B
MPKEGDAVWIDPGGYRSAVAERKAAFEKELHKQQDTATSGR